VLLVSRDLNAPTHAKVTDFGTSRTMTERVAMAHRIGVGRPAYMAPEILSLQVRARARACVCVHRVRI
jgi:serine/threonine protein kinase